MNIQPLKSGYDSAESPALEFRTVTISFDAPPILDGISFSVPRGEMRILIGPSNCGKSTIIKLAIGLLKPDSGQVFLLGKEISALQEEDIFALRDRIGVVLQTDALFDMSVAENIAYRLPRLGWDENQIETEVRRVLHIVGLENAYDMMPDELSGGMSRRAAIARAISGSPEVMFYDLPCSGLDPITSRRLMYEIIRQRDIEKVSSIYVTQNLDEVRYLCSHLIETNSNGEEILRSENNEFCLTDTRILMLSNGHIIFDNKDEFLWKAEDKTIRDFIE